MDELVRRLLTSEDRAVTEVMAFMSYNPSIGRVFEKRGVAKFQEIMTSAVDKLVKVQCEADFDKLHRECVSKVVKKIKTSRNRRPSWGQGQKAVNVFFKVYVYLFYASILLHTLILLMILIMCVI